jgi:sugar transferase (PEP-CTERM/EpsH1 system associated)
MSGILFLAHRPPFPPDRGDKIRSHHVLKALAELAPVYVGCLGESAADKTGEAELRALSASSFMPMRAKPLPLAGVEALVRGLPVSLTAFRSGALSDWVERTLEREAIDTIYVFSGQMGQYVPAGWNGRLLVDLVDVDSAKFEAYAKAKRGPMRWIDRREGRLLRAEEARLARRADATLLVSEPEAALLAGRLPAGSPARIEVLGNGIDTVRFDPSGVAPHPELAGTGPQIVFTGQMDYPPNVDAARRLIERLMPRILARHPEARLHIVGRAPVPELCALEGVNGARVWGEVPDVRPFLAAASLVAAPLTIARGVQNKVLEAMAMARPLVLTQAAAAGIPGEDRRHFALADGDDAIAERALDLLADREAARRLGAAARALVQERMSWPAMLEKLPALVGRAGEKERRDAA